MMRGVSDEKMLQIKCLLTDSSASVPSIQACGETVVFSYVSMLHLTFFTLTSL